VGMLFLASNSLLSTHPCPGCHRGRAATVVSVLFHQDVEKSSLVVSWAVCRVLTSLSLLLVIVPQFCLSRLATFATSGWSGSPTPITVTSSSLSSITRDEPLLHHHYEPRRPPISSL